MQSQYLNPYKNFFNGKAHYLIELKETITILNHTEAELTKPKNKKQPKQTKQTKPDSITKVNLRVGGRRVTCAFKCNEKLWKSFVSQIKAQGLSVCHVLEAMIYGWLYGKVYLSNTIKPIKIENLVVERAVKRVRRYAVEVEEGVKFKGERFYCGLKDSHVPRESLPLVDCRACPNSSCRRLVFEVEG